MPNQRGSSVKHNRIQSMNAARSLGKSSTFPAQLVLTLLEQTAFHEEFKATSFCTFGKGVRLVAEWTSIAAGRFFQWRPVTKSLGTLTECVLHVQVCLLFRAMPDF